MDYVTSQSLHKFQLPKQYTSPVLKLQDDEDFITLIPSGTPECATPGQQLFRTMISDVRSYWQIDAVPTRSIDQQRTGWFGYEHAYVVRCSNPLVTLIMLQDCPKGRILPGEANGQTENIETFVTYDLHSVDEKISPKPFPSRATRSFEKYLQLSP